MLDFDQFSLVEPAYLVTIVSEAVLQDSLIALLQKLKVRGYTISPVQGESRLPQLRPATIGAADSASESEPVTMAAVAIEVRAIVSQELSNVILYALREQQRSFTLLVYRQPIEALIED